MKGEDYKLWKKIYHENKHLGILLSNYRQSLNWKRVVSTYDWQSILEKDHPNLPDSWYLMRYFPTKYKIEDFVVDFWVSVISIVLYVGIVFNVLKVLLK